MAGTSSGSGKTTVALGLMGALRRRGLKVQPFKTGPDSVDPSYHTSITGEHSRNLDTWMLPKNTVLELFNRAMAGNDIAVVEGVMGLFDGHSAKGEEGSTAELAKLLKAPVLLVLDSRRGARSLAATVTGFKSFDHRSQNLWHHFKRYRQRTAPGIMQRGYSVSYGSAGAWISAKTRRIITS